MMAVLFITSIVLYRLRHRTTHSGKIHGLVLLGCFILIAATLILSWIHSSNSPLLSIEFIDNLTYTFTPLWHNRVGWVLIGTWSFTLILLISLTRLRNIFWYSGAFFVPPIYLRCWFCSPRSTVTLIPGTRRGSLKR